VSRRISACLTDIVYWMTAHNLKLNPSKTELLFIPDTPNPYHDLTVSFENSLVSPTKAAHSSFLTYEGFNLFFPRKLPRCLRSLVISKLDYCNSLLAGLPLRAIKPLQLVQNAAARLVFNLPKCTNVTPLLRSLHWLPVAARIRFKTLMHAYKSKNGPAPSYMRSMIKA
ncbi:hypothetical protein P4O66_012475, partial [Electrophorus voltai]